MSDATKMGVELLSLVQGKVPGTTEWRTEVPTGYALNGSRNKPLVCATAEAFHAYLTGSPSRVLRMLDWWVGFCDLPFSDNEELTPEEVYRSMMVYSAFAAGALARKVGHHAAEAACLANCRAHVGWLALGAGAGSGKKVTDHHLADVTKPCVLVGDGPFVTHLPYIAQAGMRGWIRNRDGGQQTFHFTESVGLSVIVGQAAGLGFERRLAPWQSDLFKATIAFSPGVAPLGLTPSDAAALAAYLGEPEIAARAMPIAGMVKDLCPNDDFEFVRHADAGVETYMLENHSSSTDDRMVDVWRAGGETAKASADDGLRSSHLHMTAREEAGRIVVEGGGRVVSVQMSAAPIAWRASARSGKFTFWIPATAPPASPPTPDVTRPSTQRESKGRPW
jgi:hypothetical protein